MVTVQNDRFGAALTFEPQIGQTVFGKPLKLLGQVPRYLLRLYCSMSKGRTTEDVVESQSVVMESPLKDTDLFSLPVDEAADMLDNHLRWKRTEFEDNLMSWTTSFFLAIQHGLRRHTIDEVQLADLHICIIDTGDFPDGTFIHDMYLLEAFDGHAGIQRLLNIRIRDYYFGEYISQGRLDIGGRSSHVSLQTLINLGLYELEPRFECDQELWAKRVIELREPFRGPTEPDNLRKSDLRTALTMGQAFGNKCALPVSLMLLSLSPRRADDQVLFHGITAVFTDEEIVSVGLDTLRVDGQRLPEVQQFGDIVQKIHKRLLESTRYSSLIQAAISSNEVDDVPFAKLSLEDSPTVSVRPSYHVEFYSDSE